MASPLPRCCHANRGTGLRLGPMVPPDARSATVVPNASAGDWTFVAARAYSAGRVAATSEVIQLAYHPTGLPPEELEPDPSDSADGFSPSALLPPTLVSVTPASPTTVTLTWTFVGCSHFDRFIPEQQSPTGEWDHLAVLRDPNAHKSPRSSHS